MNNTELDIIREYIKGKYVLEKLESYFSRHDLIGEEIFPYLGEIGKDFVVHLGERYSYHPVMKDVFIRRIPFYFYKPDEVSLNNIGDLNQYIMGILREPLAFEESEVWLERLYQALEKMFYHHKLDLLTIFNYPIDQTGHVSQTEMLFQWAHYLDLAEKMNLPEKTPKHFIVAYNYALEMVGLPPIIYEIEEAFNYEYISRQGNEFELRGRFPCGEDGQPILRWIGVKIKNPNKVWAKVDKRLKGSLYVEANPTTAIWGLNCWGKHDDGSDAWYPLYVGPQLMEFDPEALRDIRNREKLSQKQVADAIGASVRTYQKWESGHTTPDSHHLLRLMNVLDIRDTKELTRWIDIEV
ncbi:helix-turn-helix domain-containing protein [Paenibacillus allorhizosphaerae]|uniref:HTH cro/C1-type domain-containing protein n=1 Tax=Paenibacillus allorhizosphaerae TaxID=2849866 RepID=A0ABN7TQH2_9BACL|nr:helix-turn-helix transcriptional regulator [Paenibacillus allorhizosphaerae]CAG7651397.1 hypothetical protein PAECIP111802_04953 [Paenibacillus allorhizosphaerae]